MGTIEQDFANLLAKGYIVAGEFPDPNLYTQTPAQRYVGRKVRIRYDANFEDPHGPGYDAEMVLWCGAVCTIDGVTTPAKQGFDAMPDIVWVFLEEDDNDYLWDLQWLELL